MNTSNGIFDSQPSQPNGGANPFSFAAEVPHAQNPFAAAAAHAASPFAAVPDQNIDRSLPEPGKPAKIPAPRPKPVDSPFQMASENGSPFGYEAPHLGQMQSAPFSPVASEPLSLPPAPAQASPFAIHRETAPQQVATAFQPAPQQNFGAWPQAAEAPAPAPSYPIPQANGYAPAPAPSLTPFPEAPAPVAHAPAAAQYMPAPSHAQPIEATSMRQLELRAIFGVDREMTTDEILQRTRALPGVKLATKINAADVVALENLKLTLSNLGFGGGNIRLYSGNVPIEFIRDGKTMLAIQTDGGFAPGVKEAIMIVARELEKMG